MPQISIGDRSIHVAQGGQGSVEVFFVHGIRNAAWVWDPAVSRLDPRRFRWTALDLPGCGRSTAADRWQDCTIEATAALLEGLIERLCDGPPTLVGHSLGGGIVAQAVLDQPDLARSVVFVAPTPFEGLAQPLDDVLQGAFADPADVERLGRAAFVAQPDEDDFQRLVETVLDAHPSHIEGALRSAHRLSIRSRLAGIGIPTMLLGGDSDRHVSPAETFLTAAALRRPEVHIWNQVGHVPHWERPEHFVELLGNFATRNHA